MPKQFLYIDDAPIIAVTIRKFHAFDPKIKIIVVLPENHFPQWESVREEFLSDIDIQTTFGGDTRTDSVRNGLSLIGNDGLVAIHDAVRPFVEVFTIGQCYKLAIETGSGVACVPLKDSIREIIGDDSKARDRNNFVLVQTPQTFQVALIKKAYKILGNKSLTDDASVYEQAGNSVSLVEGSYSNIKITTPDDLKKA